MNSLDKRNQRAEQLANSNKELEAFIYNASHDLKGPLAASKGLVDLAKTSNDPEEIKDYLSMIQTSLDKLDHILGTLHEVALIRNGQLVFKKIDLEIALISLLNNFKGYPNFDNIKFIVRNEMKKDFYSDEILIQTILRNLIENAIKYSIPEAKNSYVKISFRESETGINIELADNGIGIPEKFHNKVFESFFRATAASSGSGLGLFIVKNALSKLGGSIEINNSKELNGAVFHLFLPRVSLTVLR